MRRPALAVCALLALTSCATSGAESTGPAASTTVQTTTAPRNAGSAPGSVIEFGTDYRFDSGLVVTVSGPKPFRPSESAYPRAERAAAFSVVVYNESGQPYRLSGLSVSATADDRAATQVVDPTQGFNGIVDADRDLPPGEIVRLSFAFVVPATTSPVRLTVRPDTSTPARAIYTGTV
ncbi:hypothetical protein ACFS2C_23985 [Prauserella oleivorans]|uniref:DUF4352 domain-containing protein n=1 Tax=Prauserella oleivorans TaxID=1478153 RepID=A0ABW5WGZ6_9PSEU